MCLSFYSIALVQSGKCCKLLMMSIVQRKHLRNRFTIKEVQTEACDTISHTWLKVYGSSVSQNVTFWYQPTVVLLLHDLGFKEKKNHNIWLLQSIINTSKNHLLLQWLGFLSSLLNMRWFPACADCQKMSFASVTEISSRARTCVKYEALVVFPVWLHPVSDQMILRCSTFMSDLLSSPVCVFQSSLSTLDQPFAPVAPLKSRHPSPNQTGKINLTLQIVSSSCGELTPWIRRLAPLPKPESASLSCCILHPPDQRWMFTQVEGSDLCWASGIGCPVNLSLSHSSIFLSIYLPPRLMIPERCSLVTSLLSSERVISERPFV